MELLADLLTNPHLWSIITPAGVVMAILGYVIFRLFQKYDKLQELRIADIKKFNEEYQQLTKDINQTLDTLLRIVGNRNGGNK
jgi:uncharacterized membrane-anchored protein YhcB (DUF1043 family)